jgi:hypothetical protein
MDSASLTERFAVKGRVIVLQTACNQRRHETSWLMMHQTVRAPLNASAVARSRFKIVPECCANMPVEWQK